MGRYLHRLDGLEEDVTRATALHCSEDEDRTRQEFKAESDINTILRRYAQGDMPNGPAPRFGEQLDFDMGLQEALHLVSDAEKAFNGLPPFIRAMYPDLSTFVSAWQKGQIKPEAFEPPPEGSGDPPEPQDGAPAGAPPTPAPTT